MILNDALQPVLPPADALCAPPSCTGQGVEGLSSLLSATGFNVETIDDCAQDFEWQADRQEIEAFGTIRARANKPCFLRMDPVRQALVILFPLAGEFKATVRDKSITACRGQALLLSGAQAPLISAQSDPMHAHASICFSHKSARKIFKSHRIRKEFYHRPPGMVVDLNTPSGEILYRISKKIFCDLYGRKYLNEAMEASHLMAELIMLMAFNDEGTQEEKIYIEGQKSAHVDRAIAFIHDSLHMPLTLASIAEAAETSTRSLQTGFQEAFAMSPMAYLRKCRLVAVHAELSKVDNLLPVGEVAYKWGFTHLGRFASQYKAEFGINPSNTPRMKRPGQ